MKIVLIITVIESAIVALVILLWRFKIAYSKLLPLQPLISNDNNMTTVFTRRALLNDSRWAFINGWQVRPQADDRTPARGSVAYSGGSPSGRRSIARRRHQAMYKEWSKARHD